MKKQVGAQTVHYLDAGSGKILLFLHGWGTSAENMWPLAESLANNYRVIALDFPGFGDSPRPKGTWNVSAYAEFVVRFLKELGIDEPHALIGHSFGGRVSIKLLGTGMLDAEKLVLIDSAGVKPGDNIRRAGYKLVAKAGKIVLMAPGLRRFSTASRSKLYKSIGSSDYVNSEDMRDIFMVTVREDLKEYAKKITVPTLLIWGSEDDETPLADARFFHTAIKNSRLKIIQSAGHFAHTDAPRKVSRFMKEFLS